MNILNVLNRSVVVSTVVLFMAIATTADELNIVLRPGQTVNPTITLDNFSSITLPGNFSYSYAIITPFPTFLSYASQGAFGTMFGSFGLYSITIKADYKILASTNAIPGLYTSVIGISYRVPLSTHQGTVYVTNNVTVTIIPPAIQIQKESTNVMVLWPGSFQGYTLQSRGSLVDSNAWSDVRGEVFTLGTQNAARLPVDGGSRYFRLRYSSN